MDGGADDVTQDEDAIEILAPVEAFKTMTNALRGAGITPEEANLRMIPNTEMELSVDQTLQVLRSIEAIEDLDDVQNVYSNLRISQEAMAAFEEA